MQSDRVATDRLFELSPIDNKLVAAVMDMAENDLSMAMIVIRNPPLRKEASGFPKASAKPYCANSRRSAADRAISPASEHYASARRCEEM